MKLAIRSPLMCRHLWKAAIPPVTARGEGGITTRSTSFPASSAAGSSKFLGPELGSEKSNVTGWNSP